jgi:hypothetical protein
LSKLFIFLKTAIKLGLCNVAYVAWYRVSLRSGIRKFKFPVKDLATGQDFFLPCEKRPGYPDEWKEALLESADRMLSGNILYYACHWKMTGNPPDWFLNPFSGTHYPGTSQHWTRLPDFHPQAGDIKNIWEASRFEWVVTLARAYAVTGNSVYLDTLNNWLRDWSKKNPLNQGPNWKCGQEASIRIFNLVNASFILQQHDQPANVLRSFIHAHLERISRNIRYALAQNNNHGVSEAAGLFIGGSWLNHVAPGKYARSGSYAQKGRRWLENLAGKLIEENGSFSQHSVNYHRMMLDTLSFCEFWRQKTAVAPFSDLFYHRAKAAWKWLGHLTDIQSGNAPDLGENDGAMLNNLHAAPYRNFKSSLNLAGALFLNASFHDDRAGNEALWWLGLETVLYQDISLLRDSLVLDGGYAILKSENSWALLRLPYFRFRPSHNDVFHFDLWYNGRNLLCDAGTYSYNPPEDVKHFRLKSVHHHNTVSFDDYEQMPDISRFLVGNWLKAHDTGAIRSGQHGEISWTGSYIDQFKNKHQRTITASENTWIIEDELTGKFNSAVIGFNINDPYCTYDGHLLTASFGVIEVPGQTQSDLRESIASDCYYEKHAIKRLNIEVSKPGIYITTIRLNPEI